MAIQGFHAHVYYVAETRESASRLRERVLAELGGRARISPLVDRPVGPHPVPMFEIDFAPGMLEPVLTVLMLHRQGHSVLVHPMTGDELRDHQEHCLWLGDRVPLDYSRL